MSGKHKVEWIDRHREPQCAPNPAYSDARQGARRFPGRLPMTRALTVLSLCSGIEAASVAWKPLGWHTAAVAEIDKAASAVLAHHYPDVPNLGDMTRFQEWPDLAVDVLVGGTPCQSFSVAGLRRGLDDPRGSLMLTFGAVARRFRPRWIVWENVPGVLSSDGGRDFGAFLGMLGELGYGFAYRVLDAQFFGLAQRRARVFVVGYLGDWRPPAAVLFERESLRGDSAPRREAGQTAPTIPSRSTAGGGLGTDFDCDGGLIARCDTAGEGSRQDYETTTLVAHAFDARQSDVIQYGDKTGPLDTDGHSIAVAFPCKDHGADAGSIAPTLRAMGHDGSHANAGGQLAVAFDTTQMTSKANRSNPQPGDPCHPLAAGAHAPAVAFNLRGREAGAQAEISDTASLRAASGGSSRSYVASSAVRRLTPRECERLQGFPDDYTLVPYRGKPMADGPRYKMLGNSMAVPVMRWIGERVGRALTVLEGRNG